MTSNTSATDNPLPAINAALLAANERPAVAVTLSALTATKNGFLAVWESEKDNKFGRSVMAFFWDVFSAVLLPLLSLLWLALSKSLAWALNPDTHTAAAGKWAEFTNWLAPKFSYEKAD